MALPLAQRLGALLGVADDRGAVLAPGDQLLAGRVGDLLRPLRHPRRLRERVEVLEHQRLLAAVAGPARPVERGVAVLEAQEARGDRDVVVDELADRIGVLDRLLVDVDERLHLLR